MLVPLCPSLHCQDWPVLLSFKATQSPPPPALSPSLLARITGVKPLSYPGQTFPSHPYASHYETSPPPLGPPHGLGAYVFSRRLSFSLLILTIPPPPPLLTGQPITLSLRVSSMVSPSLHRQGWPILLSCPPPPPLPNLFHSFPPSFLYGIPELSLLGLDITTRTYSALFRPPPPSPPTPTPLCPTPSTVSLRVSSMVPLSYHC